MFFNISIESYLALVISLIIIKSGIEMVKDSISSILGERVDINLIKSVKKTIYTFPEVCGVYDIVFNNYGPNSYTGSVHIEVPNTYTIDQIDTLQRKIIYKVYSECGIVLSAIGVYSVDKNNLDVIEARKKINKIIKKYNNILQMHGFYFNIEEKLIQFDIVISFDEVEPLKLYDKVYNEVCSLYPDYKILVFVDNDFSVSI